jgi:hypothetical protein
LRVVQNPCASVVVSRHRPSPLSHFVCSIQCIGVLGSIRSSLRARGADERDAGNERSLQPTRRCLSSVAIRQPFCRFRVRVPIVNASSRCASERRIRVASVSARGRIKSHGCTAIRAHREGSAPQGSPRPARFYNGRDLFAQHEGAPLISRGRDAGIYASGNAAGVRNP